MMYNVCHKVCFNLIESKIRYLYGVVRRGLAADNCGGQHERN